MTASISSIANTPTPEMAEFRKQFDNAIGGTLFRQMLKSLRSSTGNAAYFNGGQAEKIFQSQMDEILIEKMTEASGKSFGNDLFDQMLRMQPRLEHAVNAKRAAASHQIGSALDASV